MDLRVRWKAFASTRRGQRIFKGLRLVVTAAVVAYLIWQLSGIGWARVWAELPRTPWFYVIFALIYLSLPGFQALIFGQIWHIPPRRSFLAMLKKRVYNIDVMSYSGEVYLYFWARRRLSRPDRRILHDIKDNAIVSSVTSTLVAVGVLGGFLLSGLIRLPASIAQHELLYVLAGLVVGAGLIGLGLKFRRTLLKLPGRVLLVVFGLHLARLLVIQGLQVLEWFIVVPEVPLEVWFTLLATQIVVSRIPLLPSRDLIFVGVGIELAAALPVPTAAIAGMLVVHSMLDKVLNLLLFGVVSGLHGRRGPPAMAPEEGRRAETVEREAERRPASARRPDGRLSEEAQSTLMNT